MILEAFPTPEPKDETWIIPATIEIPCTLAILRMMSQTVRYLAVFLPAENGWEMPLQVAAKYRSLQLTARQDRTEITITFTGDPIKALLAAD